MYISCTVYSSFYICWENSKVCTHEVLILKVRLYKSECPRARVCCHTSHHLTLWTVRNVSLTLSWYLHLSERNHKYNHFPNVGSLFCQPFRNATVPLHFRHMNKWKAINMSLSLHSGTLHCMSMQRTAWVLGSGSDVRFVRQQRYVTLSVQKKTHIRFLPAAEIDD